MAYKRMRARTAATMAAAAARKGTTVPGSKTDRKRKRQAARAERRALGILPAPGTKAARRLITGDPLRWVGRTEETTWLHNAALAVTLDPRHRPGVDPNDWSDELTKRARKAYRAAWKQSGGADRPRAPRPKGAWVRVKAHRRRRPGGAS